MTDDLGFIPHSVAQQLGELQGRMVALERCAENNRDDMRRLFEDVQAIRTAIDQARGGWKTLMLVGGMAGAIGALVAKLATILGGLPR